jgi:hypothetical protein
VLLRLLVTRLISCFLDTGLGNLWEVPWNAPIGLGLLMKSGGQMSQSPVVWWYREVNCEFFGMCVEVGTVLGAE